MGNSNRIAYRFLPFLHKQFENRHFAHCIVIAEPLAQLQRNVQQYQRNLYITKKYV